MNIKIYTDEDTRENTLKKEVLTHKEKMQILSGVNHRSELK